ncbi:MAG: hypothetical protein RLZZ70_481 [Candidatus Parcubacteria bacterium]|jgi:hypothetical protein
MTDTTEHNSSSTPTPEPSVVPTTDESQSVVTDTVTEAESAVPSSTPLQTMSDSVVSTPTIEVTTPTEPSSDENLLATAAPASLVWWKKPVVLQYGIAFLIVGVMGAGLLYILEQQGRTNTAVFSTLQSWVMPEPVAATVNGEKITQAQFEKNRNQLIQQAIGQGVDPATDPVKTEIDTQALDILINTALLRQAADAAGILVTEDQVNARYDEIVTSQGGEEQLAARMAEIGITTESLREDIRGEILIQTHLTATLDPSTIEITDEEIKTFYDSVAKTAPAAQDVPPLAEVRDQIIQQLRVGKEQELVGEYVDTLRSTATIEKNTL